MVIGLEFGSVNITYVAFGNNIFNVINNPDEEVKVLTQGVIPINGNMQQAINILMDRLQTCNVTHVGFFKSIKGIDVNHTKNIEKLRNTFYGDYSSIIEIGSKSANIYTFDGNKLNNIYTNGKCAAGSGSFIETMAARLGLPFDRFIKLASETKEYASLSGRCAVFCESDIVHLFQKGVTKDKIAHGITRSVALNIKTLMGKNQLGSKTLFIGGVSKNQAVLKDLKSVFNNDNIFTSSIPFNAFSSIFSAVEMERKDLREMLEYNYIYCAEKELSYNKPIKLMDNTYDKEESKKVENTNFSVAALGVDIGSVSTKGALVASEGGKPVILGSYYRKTLGDPISAVKDVVDHIKNQIEFKNITVDKVYGGTTGSGRYLTGDFIGADLIENEISAQVGGVVSFYPNVDTIFEIGGQDSKFISIKNGELEDFEMNRVCAAGTGAFLEKQAEIIGVPIDEFGPLALGNTNPPDFDNNCTVFTEMCVKDNLCSVPKEDLAASVCIASVKNYLNKNVDGRHIGDNIVFSGAVAFNKGMVAAFETLLGKKINVPKYPHINGAIGIGWLTLQNAKDEPKFKGFENILEQKYSLSTFKCKECNNNCDVSVFDIKISPKLVENENKELTKTEGETYKYYYNDRCEKYSGKPQTSYQINLFDKFSELMNENMEKVPQVCIQGKTIGYPRGMLFNEYYTLFGAFFKACGFEVVLSDETNKSIGEIGSVEGGNKPCFPFKVAFGHFHNILDKKTDYIFMPRIINGEKVSKKTTQYCPYLQAGPDIIVGRAQLKSVQNNLDRPIEGGDKILSPTFYMAEGSVEVKKILVNLGIALGVEEKLAKKSADIAFECYWDFKDDLAYTGKNILDLYKGNIYVVLGHPYVLYDKFLNMNIGDKLSKMGYMPVPMDYIIQRRETSWHIYQKEIEKKLELGAYLRDKKGFKSVVLSYYACGMDAFSNKFYKEELAHPCYIMNLDEHTSDAGVVTRLEAFSHVRDKKNSEKKKSVKISDFAKIKDKILWLPSTDFSSDVLAAAFNLFGINAMVLPESPDVNFNKARKVISEDVCLPCLATMEDILYRISQKDFDAENEAFFQAGANGPCRLGMYPQRQKLALEANVPLTVIDNNYFKNGLPIDFVFLTWQSLLVHDYLYKLLLHYRPYEIKEGKAENIYDKYALSLTNVMKQALRQIKNKKNTDKIPVFDELLQEACEEFASNVDMSVKKPIIGITGEFYIKLNPRSNKNIVKYLESKGFEVWMSSLCEYFHYSNYITSEILDRKLKNKTTFDKLCALDLIGEKIFRDKAQTKINFAVNHYNKIIGPYMDGLIDGSVEEMVNLGSKILDKSVTGEAICSLGKASEFFHNNLEGIINIAPFNCMPGNIVDMLLEPFRGEHENIPLLCLSYDGFEDNRDRIDTFLNNLI